MKKTIILLAVALIAVPAWAGVTVTGSDQGGLTGAITYSVTGTPKVRAFALNISVNNGATIDAVTVGNTKYTIYPGTIVINGNNVDANGTPVAVKAQLPGDTLDGLGTSGVTLEMASLYVGEANAPATSGTLVTITVSGDCDVTIAGNNSRGNVVMEDLSAVSPTYTGFHINGGVACHWDWDGSASDGFVNLGDLFAMIGVLPEENGYEIDSTDPNYNIIWDWDGSAADGFINLGDLFALIGVLPEETGYEVACPI